MSIDADMQRLQPYLEALGKDSNTNRAVVVKVFADPDLFAGYDQIQQAAVGTWDDKTQRTLDLFSYGTLSDYTSYPDQYLSLNDAQLSKLRQLTVLALIQNACQQRQNVVSYSSIQHALQLSENDEPKQQLRDTEIILAQLIAAKVISGKLSQKERVLHLLPSTATAGSHNNMVVRSRDVRPSEILELIQGIQRLRNKLVESNRMLNAVEKAVVEAKQQDEALWEAAKTKHHKDQFEQMELDSSSGGGGSPKPTSTVARRQKRTRGGHHGTSSTGYASRQFGA